jgi:hypothetical protein
LSLSLERVVEGGRFRARVHVFIGGWSMEIESVDGDIGMWVELWGVRPSSHHT